MSRNIELVEEFRGIVDKVIQQQVDQCQNGPGLRSTWLGYDTLAVSAGLEFTSINPSDGRYQYVPHSQEHVWSVAPSERMQVGSYSGHIAIVSFAGTDEKLFRNWAFDSGMQMLHAKCMSPIEDSETMGGVLDWVKSPHLYLENLRQVAELSDEEKSRIGVELDGHRETAQGLHDDLAEIARSRRAPMPDIWISS